jgi:adenine-specific DNA-methyltransferase
VERVAAEIAQFFVSDRKGKKEIYKKKYLNPKGYLARTWWDSPAYSARDNGTRVLVELFGASSKEFEFPKALQAVEDSLTVCAVDEESLVFDFFGGSGTTAHAVINLNRADDGQRKYILVEMGEHFNTVILPRIKKVVFSGKWKDGKAVLNNGDGEGSGKGISHFAKYYQLEQYEETLRRGRYDDAPLLAGADAYNAYVFLRDLKLLEAVRLDKAGNKVQVNLTTLYDGIDLAETLSCVTGKGIKRITQESVEFQDGTSASLTDPDWQLVKPLIWW